MKKLLFFCAALTATFTATGQHYYTDSANPDITRHSLRIAPQRVEFVLPEVGGYTVYKADLHTHSIYSDGDCTPEFRVREAWYDGLDVLAITEHVEYRRHEGKMLNFLKGYVPEGTEPVNYNIIAKPADEQGIRSDLNFPVKLAQETAAKYGITIIPGAEITREPIAYGHYNALFTTDNNAIYAADRIKCIQPLTGERPTDLQKRARQEATAEKTAAPEPPQEETQGAEPGNTATPETFYKVRQNPYSDSPENSYILQEYVAQDNGMAKLGDILYTGTPEKCRELLGKLETGELTQDDVKELYAKAQEAQPTAEPGQETPEPTATEKEPDKDTFSIYQLKRGDETRDYRFEPYDRLQAAGLSVDPANYDLIYTAPLAPDMTLGDISIRFNIDHPADFKGHSLSTSDVVVLHQNGQDTAHYADSYGYREVPEFLQEQTPQLTPDTRMTGEQIRTPRGSFSVTDMTAEQMKEAGYGFHHTSEDGKYLIMGNGTQAFAIAAEQPEKVNPLKHVEDTIEQNDNHFDGIINNMPTPTADELEAKARNGEQISLAEYAAALKAEKEQGKETKPGKKTEKKPSIRAQLKADKERAAQRKQARSKSQDLERS